MYTPQQLAETFYRVRDSKIAGIPGAMRIKASNNPDGRQILVGAVTHGNEVSGLAPQRY